MKTYRLAWATDIHLNFVDGDAGPFCDLVTQTGAGGLVITGDISEAKTIEQDLAAIESLLSLPIYFVLGNHDFYNGSIAAVRKAVASLCRSASVWRPRMRASSDMLGAPFFGPNRSQAR